MDSIREDNRGIHADTLFFNFGKVIWIPSLLAGLWIRLSGYTPGPLLVCSVKTRIGIPCPGCGGTRALFAFFAGHMLESFRFNPTIVFVFCAYIHFMLLYIYRNRFKKSGHERPIPMERYAYVLAAVMLGQWFVKLGTLFL